MSAGTRPAGDGLAVHALRRKVARTFGTQTVLSAVTVVLVIALVAVLEVSAGPVPLFSLLPFAFIVVVQVVVLIWSAQQWVSLRRPGPCLVIDYRGVWLRTRSGSVRAPWDAVRSVTSEARLTGGRRLRVRLVPASHPAASGIVGTGLSRRDRRNLARPGMLYPLRFLDIDPDRPLEAVREYSEGRLSQSMEG